MPFVVVEDEKREHFLFVDLQGASDFWKKVGELLVDNLKGCIISQYLNETLCYDLFFFMILLHLVRS
jgi:hypothetical protein